MFNSSKELVEHLNYYYMFKKIFIVVISVFLIGIVAFWLHYSKRDYTTSGDVHIKKVDDGYVLIRNGKPFYIVGAGGVDHFRELSEAGANSIRTWDTANLGAILDSAQKYNLAVIAGLPMVKSSHLEFFYKNKDKVSKQHKDFKLVVNKYKNHPALLMWICGNELDFPYRPKYYKFYKAFNNVVDMIHADDPNHPVTTSLTNFSRRNIYNLLIKSPQLDLIAINTFGGQLEILRDEVNKFSWFWDGPFFLSEWAGNGYWEESQTKWNVPLERTSTYKAERIAYIYNNNIPFDNKNMLGTCVFYWGNKQEKTHTWYSLFVENGAKTESVHVIENLWNKKNTPYTGPKVNDIIINGEPNSYSLYSTKQLLTAELAITSNNNDSVSVIWELLNEDWSSAQFAIQSKPFMKEQVLLSSVKNTCTFNAPNIEGPYRLFAFVYDSKGFVATANKPIYVLKHDN